MSHVTCAHWVTLRADLGELLGVGSDCWFPVQHQFHMVPGLIRKLGQCRQLHLFQLRGQEQVNIQE